MLRPSSTRSGRSRTTSTLADEQGFEIRHILETHNHADHVSGRGRLAAATAATIHVSPTPGLAYEHEVLDDGDALEFGDVRIEALATPGHRPEHTAYLVYDRARGDEPWAVLTATRSSSATSRDQTSPSTRRRARASLHASLERLLALPDHVQVLPGHLGGSLCGSAAMSEAPASTIGFERRFNPLLQPATDEEFVASDDGLAEAAAAELPPHRRAQQRPPSRASAVQLHALEPTDVQALLAGGAVLLDGRDPAAWARAHVPGSINATMVRAAVGSRAAAAADPESPVVVTAADDRAARTMARRLEAVGFRRIVGFLAGGVDAWHTAGLPLETLESIPVAELAELIRRHEILLLDVRDPGRVRRRTRARLAHVPYQELRATTSSMPDLVNGKPVAIVCAAGNRAPSPPLSCGSAGCRT